MPQKRTSAMNPVKPLSEQDGTRVLRAQETRDIVVLRAIEELRRRLDVLEHYVRRNGDEIGDMSVSNAPIELIETDHYAERVVDGVFNGEQMIGEEGVVYFVPQNYASKSQLVEGDLLRVTIRPDGRLLFKQKGPIERQRKRGILMQDERTDTWSVLVDGQKYRVLKASVAFFHAHPGDEAVILVPSQTPSRWAAVETIILSTEL